MLQSMRQAKRHGTKLAVVYIDLDGFKEVNDSYGHDVGDQLLVSMSRYMQENLREEDTISRLGGDEFVAVLINLKQEDESVPLLKRLLAAVSKPIEIEQFNLKVSASLGVTFYPQNEEIDADQLLRQADQTMYQAKLSGKNHPLSIEVDNWVIRQSLEQLSRWQEQGLNISISVNISPYYLQKSEFATYLQEILANFPKIDPHLLELEILESSAFEDIQQVSKLINNCRELGIEFALDDFGTGYSSLSYLQRLPASLLKIDQSFIRFILENPDDLAIIDAMLSLAQAFRRKVIAEGVETIEHGDILLQMGCELGQGYGIARPMSADIFEQWAASWKPDISWREAKPVAHEKLYLLFFDVQTRSWAYAIESYLGSKNGVKPELFPDKDMLSTWIDGEGSKLYGESECFKELILSHKQIHDLAKKLIDLKQQYVSENVLLEGMARLHLLKGEISTQLKQLMYS